VAFVGGAGIADQWMFATRRGARWRDTMFRVDGPAVASLESTFAENWVEASGQLLTDVRPATGSALDIPRPRPAHQHEGRIPALVIDSSPTQGRSTRARMVFQALIASARRRIFITTPYFLPDRSLRREIIRAMCERRVEVVILTAGRKSDQLLTRRSSRRIYGELLQAGARIYEYEPAMMHAKTIVVDGVWSLIGSTNLDPRSFCLNDEINIAALDTDLATRLEADFAADVASSRVVTLQAWRRRPAFERLHEWLGWALERQQ
jgi:cardiolipin synthase